DARQAAARLRLDAATLTSTQICGDLFTIQPRGFSVHAYAYVCTGGRHAWTDSQAARSSRPHAGDQRPRDHAVREGPTSHSPGRRGRARASRHLLRACARMKLKPWMVDPLDT